jgi:hypothetical protein
MTTAMDPTKPGRRQRIDVCWHGLDSGTHSRTGHAVTTRSVTTGVDVDNAFVSVHDEELR